MCSLMGFALTPKRIRHLPAGFLHVSRILLAPPTFFASASLLLCLSSHPLTGSHVLVVLVRAVFPEADVCSLDTCNCNLP